MIVKVYKLLKSKGIDVYFQGQKKGKCNKEYVVIKDNGQSNLNGSNKVGYKVLDVIIFFPLNRFTQLELFKKEIKVYLKELNGIKNTGNETPIIIDNERKAYTTSIIYQIHKRLE